MSYSLYANYRTKATAVKAIKAKADLPEAVKTLLVDSIEALQPDEDSTFVKVTASGHSSHTLQVERHAFTT